MSANKKRFQKKTLDKIIFFPNRFKKIIKQLFSNNVNQHIISPLQTFLVNMSQAILSDKKILIISIIAAATSVIAGIMHLQMAPRMLSGNPDDGVFFIVAGALQIFWAVPVIKRGGRIWQIIGIVGTIVLMALWYATRTHLIPRAECKAVHRVISQDNFQEEISQAESFQEETRQEDSSQAKAVHQEE